MLNSYVARKILVWQALVLNMLLLAGCSSTSELFREDPMEKTVDPDYLVVYYIHADADYLYYDAAGKSVRGNRKIFDTAIKVAEEAKSGEVFVFYQESETNFLGLFPRKKSWFYHYTNGELSSQVKYHHSNKKEDFLTTEAQLYNQYKSNTRNEDQRNYFLYFGHEIPDADGKKYHRTLPDIIVNTESFSIGIQRFLASNKDRFDLSVLSTCNNGTPMTAEHLMPYSDALLASPQNLHLSHIDSKTLNLLESHPEISSIQLADSMAERTYQRLENEIQTTITLTVYDLDFIRKMKSELHAFSKKFNALDSTQNLSDNIDCNQFEFFDGEIFENGLKTWYRPARFGRKATTTHSGWGCKPLLQK